tara:strand:- start:5923 stop:6039 length:117 start_codon:yes stop_codon:yes gene_type:complete
MPTAFARALTASPLEDIRSLLDVGLVMKGGNIHKHQLR